MTESFDLFVQPQETFNFGMFVFTVGTAGLHNLYPVLKIFMALIFRIAINSLTHLYFYSPIILWHVKYSRID